MISTTTTLSTLVDLPPVIKDVYWWLALPPLSLTSQICHDPKPDGSLDACTALVNLERESIPYLSWGPRRHWANRYRNLPYTEEETPGRENYWVMDKCHRLANLQVKRESWEKPVAIRQEPPSITKNQRRGMKDRDFHTCSLPTRGGQWVCESMQLIRAAPPP